MFGWSWSLAFHLINGVRHLVQDAGYGYAIDKFVRSSWVSIFGSLLLTALIWVFALLAHLRVMNRANWHKHVRLAATFGVVVFLLWLWITNLALLFGAELDSELERGRELQSGLPAEREIQLPPRDTRNITKAEKKEREDIERGRELREAHADVEGRDRDRA